MTERAAVIGLGANLGDRGDTLAKACCAIGSLVGVSLVRRSSVYLTKPVGGPPQPDYFNAAAAILTTRPPLELLSELLLIEQALGRVRGVRFGPRTIDLDLLWMDGVTSATAVLGLPHPRLTERAFALVPLVEVWPHAADPRTGQRYASILRSVDPSGVRRLGDPPPVAASAPAPDAVPL